MPLSPWFHGLTKVHTPPNGTSFCSSISSWFMQVVTHTHRTSVTSLDNHLNVNVEQGSHRPQTLPQCCHLESFYFKHRSFSCHYICKDIMCKHVINIQHALCSVVANRPWLQQVVLSILHAKPKAVCKPRCLSLAATSSSLSLCANMTSSIKAKIRNISLCCQRRTEPWP